MTATRPLFWSSVRLAAAALTSITLCGLVLTALGAGPSAREQLEFRFPDPPRRPGAALDVAATNARLAAAALLAAWAVQRRSALRAPLDCALGLVAAVNLALVAVALGAYGGRLLESVAPHGALELAAFSVCGASYLAARKHDLSDRRLVGAASLALALLAAAAVIETYLQLGASR